MDVSLPIVGFILGVLSSWIIIRWRLGTFQEQSRKFLHEMESAVRKRISEIETSTDREKQRREEAIQKAELHLTQEKERSKRQHQQTSEKEESLKELERTLRRKEQALAKAEARVQEQSQHLTEFHEQLSGMTREEAKSLLLTTFRDSLENECAHIRHQRLEEEMVRKSFESLQTALERTTSLCSKEHFIEALSLHSKYETVAPKLIGKDGRIIQTLEHAANAHISFDAKEQLAYIGASSARARWIAKETILRLIEKEKITPAIVLEEAERAQKRLYESPELLNEIVQHLKAFSDVTLSLHQDIRKKLNLLFISNSLGQNLFQHSLEVGKLMHQIAIELSLPPENMFLTGLLHDIGKVLDTSWGKDHAEAGCRFLSAHGVGDAITSAIASHHRASLKISHAAHLLAIADRISGGCLLARGPQQDKRSKNPLKALLDKVQQQLDSHHLVASSWASFRSSEEHTKGSIEAVVRLKESINQDARERVTRDLLERVAAGGVDNRILISLITH